MAVHAHRYHDLSVGHRVYNQGSKCEMLHGHNYRIHFNVEAEALDEIGMVLDFGIIKSTLCQWLEDSWDHKFLVWEQDPWSRYLIEIDPTVVWTPFNPTAENMAKYLVETVGPALLGDYRCRLDSVTVEETRKCSASFSLPQGYKE